MQIQQTSINWAPSFRIVASRFPPINFFERIAADPADWETLLEIERMTDPTVNVGDLRMLANEDRISGPGSGRVLPSFTFLDPNPPGSRFSNHNFGAYYCSANLETAIAETIHHRTAFMLNTKQAAQDLDQLVVLANIQGSLHDITGMRSTLPAVYNVSDYAASQSLATSLRADGSMGILYDSIRRPGHNCAAILRARIISNAREDRHITLSWNGKAITGYYDKGNFTTI